MEILLHTILYATGVYLFFNCLYLLFFSLAGHRSTRLETDGIRSRPFRRFCILMPAYREDRVILETSLAALNHGYKGDFQVYVIADGLQPKTLQTIAASGAEVIEVAFEKSTKGKALQTALQAIPAHAFDVALVLDVDNVMAPGFLHEVNDAFSAGYRVVQAHRTAKSTDSAFALLDACNEEINNHIFRKGHFALGMSSSLIGSGMAFDFSYLKKLLHGIGETAGEDKEIDFRILKNQVKIAYLHNTLVYDEKIENAAVFTKQRTRWIATQVEFLRKYAAEGLVQFFKQGNVEFLDKLVQTALLPRTLLIGVLSGMGVLSVFIPYGPRWGFWAGLFLLLSTALLLALPARLYTRQLWLAVVRLPYAIFCMCLALFRINSAKSSFLPTPHRVKEAS
ncbi:glycosyltransferase family 2 protein [Pontibacter sp. E15-1]|uniref:glycosyltransferase n=1 Tax=Pontibacter sp. E15-1 TaxID=2919918 RepID=UPI001F500DB3|nr:glycosyltransferase family 2 protein [Pontibacter sp. E15-1]MCJ8163620.1 glycosyltransferase family 2 protein [Pontibacter sp. E15-1]